jgi:DICT domain-containing protein
VALDAQAVVLSAFQDARYFTDEIARRYARLAERAPLVAVLGRDLNAEPAPGVRGGVLEPDDPLCREWGIAVVSPHFCASLVAPGPR